MLSECIKKRILKLVMKMKKNMLYDVVCVSFIKTVYLTYD